MEFNLDEMKKTSDGDVVMYFNGNPRSIFYDEKSLKLIGYTYPPLELTDHIEPTDTVKEFLEGTTVTIFHHNDSWKITTASFLDAGECYWKSKRSILELAKDCTHDISWNEFLETHDRDHIYMYNLIHYENIHLIDYSYKFGINYKTLQLFAKRKKYTCETIEIDSTDVLDMKILQRWNQEMLGITHSQEIRHAGLIINRGNNFMKIYTEPYEHIAKVRKFKNVGSFDFYNRLYKQNDLLKYFKRFPRESKWQNRDIFKLIDNMYQTITKQIKYMSEAGTLPDFVEKYIDGKEELKDVYWKGVVKRMTYTDLTKAITLIVDINLIGNFLSYYENQT